MIQKIMFIIALIVTATVAQARGRRDDSRTRGTRDLQVAQCFLLSSNSGTSPTQNPVPVQTPAPAQNPTPAQTPAPALNPTPVSTPSPVTAPTNGAVVMGQTNPGNSTNPIVIGGYVFVLKSEPGNNGDLSADTYAITQQGQVIKQVGHAEVVLPAIDPNNPLNNFDFLNSSDSPFPFEISISNGNATLVTDGLFAGDTLSNQTVQCRVRL